MTDVDTLQEPGCHRVKARFAEDQGRVGHLSPHMTYEGFAGPHMKAFDLR